MEEDSFTCSHLEELSWSVLTMFLYLLWFKITALVILNVVWNWIGSIFATGTFHLSPTYQNLPVGDMFAAARAAAQTKSALCPGVSDRICKINPRIHEAFCQPITLTS